MKKFDNSANQFINKPSAPAHENKTRLLQHVLLIDRTVFIKHTTAK